MILPNGRMKTLTLKEKGKRALGINEPECDRHGGTEHRYWCSRIAGHLRSSGYEVTEEAPIGSGKTVDVVAERDGKRIAFEIETGKSDAVGNVEKCLAAGIDKVVVVAMSRDMKESLRHAVSGSPRIEVLAPAELISTGTHTPRP